MWWHVVGLFTGVRPVSSTSRTRTWGGKTFKVLFLIAASARQVPPAKGTRSFKILPQAGDQSKNMSLWGTAFRHKP